MDVPYTHGCTPTPMDVTARKSKRSQLALNLCMVRIAFGMLLVDAESMSLGRESQNPYHPELGRSGCQVHPWVYPILESPNFTGAVFR